MRNLIAMIFVWIGIYLAVTKPAFLSSVGFSIVAIAILFGFKKKKQRKEKQGEMLRCPATGNLVIDPKSPVCAVCSKRFY